MTMTQEPPFEWNEQLDVFVRKGSLDHYIFKEQNAHYSSLGLEPGDRVLDIGAHIGAFALFAAEHDAASITCVEPDPINVQILRKNLEQVDSSEVEIVQAAAVCDEETRDLVPLYLSPAQGYMNATVEKAGFSAVPVRAARLGQLLAESGANAVKIDIEGGEYDLLLRSELPEQVEKLGLECHIGRKRWREKRFPALLEKLRQSGFVANDETEPTKWSTICITWRRS